MTASFNPRSNGTDSVVGNRMLTICDAMPTSEGGDGEQNREQRRMPVSGFIIAGASFTALPWAAFSPAGSVHLQYGTEGDSQGLHFQTLFDANGTYAGISTAKVRNRDLNISHVGIEEGENLTARFSLLQHAMLDRNSVQGLHLQQLYGGGCGITALNRAKEIVEIPVTIDYVNQRFANPSNTVVSPPADTRQAFVGPSIGANIADSRLTRFPLLVAASISPSWSLREIYAANILAEAEEKISRRVGISISFAYTYIDNSPATFSGSSMQVSVGTEYSFP